MKNHKEIKAFGLHLRSLREKANLSQEEFANDAEIARATLQRIEKGEYATTLDTLIILAKTLKISLPSLLDFND